MVKTHEKYMQRALQLAEMGKFKVAPNPRVGAVIVMNNQIIGEGYHQEYGRHHAEVNAINSVTDSEKLKQSTLYITLEPCSHYGKTPPCTDLIIKKRIPRVVIATKDPFERVNGSGIEKLKSNGVEVVTDVLKQNAQWQNRRFFTFHQKKRPYIILKWAETKDGFISRSQNDPKKNDNWITSSASKQLVHLWRAEEDAILIGRKTAEVDNPELTCREVKGRNPIRIIIDKDLKLSKKLNVFNQKSTTYIVNQIRESKHDNLKFVKVDSQKNTLKSLMKKLYAEQVQSVIIEGGTSTLNLFIKVGLWDEARRFIGDKLFGSGIKAPEFNATYSEKECLNKDIIYTYFHL